MIKEVLKENLLAMIYIWRESDKFYVRRCEYIHGNRTKKTCNGGHRTIKKGASTDPKKHFEVINFILRSFCELSRGDLSRKNFRR